MIVMLAAAGGGLALVCVLVGGLVAAGLRTGDRPGDRPGSAWRLAAPARGHGAATG